MKVLKIVACSVVILCVGLAEAVAVLTGVLPTARTISTAPMVHALQPPHGLYADYFHTSEGALGFSRARTGDARQSAAALRNSAATSGGLSARPAVVSAPVISGQSQDQTVFQGGYASFSVSTTGTDPMTYQWFKDGAAVPGATSPTLTLNNVQASDAGQYSAVVRNTAGSAESFPVTLTVKVPAMPPTITGQPQDQTVAIGGLASFSVSATGAEPLTFQWLKNGFNIPGETSSTLTLHNVQTTDTGQYSIVVRNAYGPVTSNPATLRLLMAIAPMFDTLSWSQANGFSAALHGQPQASYRIQTSINLVDWVDVPNMAASGTLTQIQDPDAINAPQRFYRAVAPGGAGAP